MGKMTFNEALERLGEDRPVDASEVQSRALRRIVWVAEWHYPGCLNEAMSICTTKADAINSALMYAENEEGPPRGMCTALKRTGYFETKAFGATAINRVYRAKLADMLQ